MARHKAGKIVRMALRGQKLDSIMSTLKDNYIRGVQQGAEAFSRNFVEYLKGYLPHIKNAYAQAVMNATGAKDLESAFVKYYAEKSTKAEQVWRDVINATREYAAKYRASKMVNDVNTVAQVLAGQSTLTLGKASAGISTPIERKITL